MALHRTSFICRSISSLRRKPSVVAHQLQRSTPAAFTTRRLFHISPTLCQTTEINQSQHEQQIREQQRRNEDAGQLTELVRDFLDPAIFFKSVNDVGIDFFTGVPDSLLKDFCAYVTANSPQDKHIITANEGSAVALAAGYHLATGQHAMVYLQNSGLGNIVNPVMSMAVPSIYSVPMLLLIGWRGEPGKRDEPQHMVQGQATPGLLAALGIPFQPLPDYQEGAEQALLTAKHYMDKAKGPYAFLVKRQTFLPYKLPKSDIPDFPLNREQALKTIVDNLGHKDVVVSTTGMLSRELFEYRVEKDMGHEKDFLTVGSMGHASAIAFGIATQKPKRQVFCLDGDGAMLMHMGTMTTIGQSGQENFKHIVLNNGAHDSVGGQPTVATNHDVFNFQGLAKACGYTETMMAVDADEIADCVIKMRMMKGPVLLEIKVAKGGRKDLGRPTRTPLQNKEDFMHFLAIN